MTSSATRNLSRLGLVYASLIWGSTFYLIKDLLKEAHPLLMIGYRFVFAALLCLVVLILQKKNIIRGFRQGAVLGICLWLGFVFQTYGLAYTTASNSGFITGLYVPLVSVFAVTLFHKKMRLNQWLAVGLSFAGLWFLSGSLEDMNRGDILTLGTAVAVAFHILFSDRYVRNAFDPITLGFHQFLVVGFLSLGAASVLGVPYVVYPTKLLSQLAYLAIFPTIGAFIIQTYAQRHLDAVNVAIIFTLEPVFAALFSWTLGGEKMIPMKAFGGVLIVLAMMVSELKLQLLSGSGLKRSAS